MDITDKNIKAYEKQQEKLEAENTGKWVLFYNGELISLFDDFEMAAEQAVKKFGAGPYLIRQVGSSSVTLPASVVYKLS